MAISSAKKGISSPAKIVANIFISFIGAGLLGLPYAFKESGLLEGVLIMAAVGYLSVVAMLMLIDCKYAILSNGGRPGGRGITIESKAPLLVTDRSESDKDEFDLHMGCNSDSDITYGDIGLYAYGVPGKRIVDILIMISQTGFCCGYLIYLCENLKRHLAGLTQGQWLVLLLPPIYGLTLFRHLRKLAVFSLFAQVSNIFAVAVVFWFDFSHMKEVSFHPEEVSLKGFPFFFAVSIYCYEGAGMILSLEESVSQHKKKMFKRIFVLTMIALTILYISFGAAGYISFGPYTQQIITLNLHNGVSSFNFAALVQICLGISFFFTYPLMLFPVTHLIDKFLHCEDDKIKGNTVRLVFVILTGLIVIIIPSFAILASLIGATCCTLLAFILPAIFHMRIFENRLTKGQKAFDIFLIFLGILGTVIGLWDTFHRIANQFNSLDGEVKFGRLNQTGGLQYKVESFHPQLSALSAMIEDDYDFNEIKKQFSKTDKSYTADNEFVNRINQTFTSKSNLAELAVQYVTNSASLPTVSMSGNNNISEVSSLIDASSFENKSFSIEA